MKKIKMAGLAACACSLVLLGGCGVTGYYAGVSVGPPAPLVEGPYGVAPGPDYIWTPGYYDWYGNAWSWRHGEWRRRPHPEDSWVGPRWEHRGHGYVYHDGGWSHDGHFHH